MEKMLAAQDNATRKARGERMRAYHELTDRLCPNGLMLMGRPAMLAFEEMGSAFQEGFFLSAITLSRTLLASVLMSEAQSCWWCGAEEHLKSLEGDVPEEWSALVAELLDLAAHYLPGANEIKWSRRLVAADCELDDLMERDALRCMEIALLVAGVSWRG